MGTRAGRCVWVGLMLLPGLVVPAGTAEAHKVVVFATADGETIRGEAFFRGGAPIADAKVIVFDPGGQKLDETTTDAEGNFTFVARSRFDHRFVVDAGSGHVEEYVVPAEELPEDLPAPRSPVQTAAEPDRDPPTPPETARGPLAKNDDSVSLEEKVDALAGQIRQLRGEINRYEQTTRFHDVLGGIGYIVGVTGLLYYYLGVRRKERKRE